MHQCQKEVYWKRVNDYNQFAEQISSITFSKVLYGIQIPSHCIEGHHIQQNVHIIFEPDVTHDEASIILDEIGLSWDSLTTEQNQQIFANGGSVFTRPHHDGDWILKAPCLDCYCDLLKNEKDLSKSFLLSFL